MKGSYSLKKGKDCVICTRTDIQINLEIDNIVEEQADVFRIAQDIVNENVPIKYTSVLILPSDIEGLLTLAKSKSLILKINLPVIEITYG